MGKGIFITGTDTGIGKTFVTSGLIRAVKRKEFSACPMKPVESGCRLNKGNLVPADALSLMKVSGVDESLDLICPYRLRHPLAPAVAAELEGVRMNRRKILSAYNRIAAKYDLTLVEGAGGVMVPVYKKYFFLDLMKDLCLPVIIVSRPTLGTINHTLLTIEALKNQGLMVKGVIINYSSKTKKGIAEKTNPGIIEKLGRVRVLGVIPYLTAEGTGPVNKIFDEIVRKIF